MNLAYRFPIIYWNCACLLVDSGSTNGEGTNYDKIARAISKMRSAHITVNPVDINKSDYGFKPDVTNNAIWFGLKGMLNVGDDLIDTIIKQRPYLSIKDFYYRVKPNKSSMIALIKGGAFDSLMNRKEAMVWYLLQVSDLKERLTLANMPTLIKHNLIPNDEELHETLRIYEFNRYLKARCKNGDYYTLDTRALTFLAELGFDNYIINLLSVKTWDKAYQSYMDVFRNWIKENKDTLLQQLNDNLFMEQWRKYAQGSYATWEMEVLCFYYHPHELTGVNVDKYGISDFTQLPEEPEVERFFPKNGRKIPIFKLTKICGTCIAKDKDKGLATILTLTGPVEVRFTKEYFALFDKQISVIQNGEKTIVEKSWFNRGNMILVQGFRRGDTFVAKNYKSTNGHQLYRIVKLEPNGDLILTNERYKGVMEESE